jgi:hypothetical protein
MTILTRDKFSRQYYLVTSILRKWLKSCPTSKRCRKNNIRKLAKSPGEDTHALVSMLQGTFTAEETVGHKSHLLYLAFLKLAL